MDVALPGTRVARWLYRIALWHFKRATSRQEGLVAKDAFHQMRRCEAQLNLLRSQLFDPSSPEAFAVEETLRHCRYLNGEPAHRQGLERGDPGVARGAMKGDAARGVHLILEAIRYMLDGREGLAQSALDEAWGDYIHAGYGSGLYRVQAYEWVLFPPSGSGWRSLLAAPRRLRDLRRLRSWYVPRLQKRLEPNAGPA